MTSCIDCPRTATGDCSPSAHSTASVTLDLPEPLGPTMTLVPGPNSSRVRSWNDLNPLTVIDCRYMPRPSSFVAHLDVDRLQGDLRRLLLGVLLGATDAAGELDALDGRAHREGPVVRRAVLGHHRVPDDLAAPREPLLQRGLEVHGMLERLRDLGRERAH